MWPKGLGKLPINKLGLATSVLHKGNPMMETVEKMELLGKLINEHAVRTSLLGGAIIWFGRENSNIEDQLFLNELRKAIGWPTRDVP